MALPASGLITLYDIAAEFGGAVPHRLQEYYGAGGAPASGLISIQDFYGLSAIADIELDNGLSEFTLAIGNSKGWYEVVAYGTAAPDWQTTYLEMNGFYTVDGKFASSGGSRVDNAGVPVTPGVSYTWGIACSSFFASGVGSTCTAGFTVYTGGYGTTIIQATRTGSGTSSLVFTPGAGVTTVDLSMWLTFNNNASSSGYNITDILFYET